LCGLCRQVVRVACTTHLLLLGAALMQPMLLQVGAVCMQLAPTPAEPMAECVLLVSAAAGLVTQQSKVACVLAKQLVWNPAGLAEPSSDPFLLTPWSESCIGWFKPVYMDWLVEYAFWVA
jgi:hypothetical protein